MVDLGNYSQERIEDLCIKVTSGGTPSRKNPDFYTGDIPWLKTGELKGWFVYDAVEKITQEAIKKSSAKTYPKNTVLMAMYGDGRTIGSVAITAIVAASNQASCAMIVNQDKCLPLFLFYSLKHYRETIVNLALGGAQRNLNQGTIKNFEINCPPLTQQKKIVETLSNYDNLIENNNRRIAILEDMAQSLYREWFVNFRYPGYADSVDKGGNQKLIDSPLGKIPEGWEVKRIKDLGAVNTGKTPSKKKEENYISRDVYFIKTPDMHSGMFVISTNEMLSNIGANSQKNKYIPSWSICVSCIGTAGVVALTSVTSQTNQQINTLVPESKIFTEYLYFVLKSLKKTIENYGATGATMTNLSKSKFEALEMLLPNFELVKSFHESSNPIFKQILVLMRKNENLKQQRDMLLPKLISGQIEL